MIDWIDKEIRVPEDRRRVLVWAKTWSGGGGVVVSRFNPSSSGGRFDCEGGRLVPQQATHWAEINDPEYLGAPPAKSRESQPRDSAERRT